MSVAGTHSFSLGQNEKPLFVGLLISLVAHGLLIAAAYGAASALFAAAKRQSLADMHRFQTARASLPQLREPPLLFVEVNPEQATPQAPKNPKYYSSQNAQAANADSQIDTETPKIDGSQVHVPKAETTPRSKAFPLQPSTPKDATPPPDKGAEAEPQKPPGDLAMAKPNPTKPQEAPVVSRERPRTLAQVQQQPTALAGERIKQEGGVRRRRLVPSFDTIGTAFGEYDARIIAAIQQHWYDLVDSQVVSREKTGKVVLEFRLNYDGRITDMKEVDSDVGPLLAYLCKKAVGDPAPYERWPSDMRRLVGMDYREVRFTFYYE